MGIAAVIARAKKSVRAAGLPGAVVELGGTLRSNAIPAPLRQAAARIADLLRVPDPSTERVVVPLVPERPPHAVDAQMQDLHGGVCPFTGKNQAASEAVAGFASPVLAGSTAELAVAELATVEEPPEVAAQAAPVEAIPAAATSSEVAEALVVEPAPVAVAEQALAEQPGAVESIARPREELPQAEADSVDSPRQASAGTSPESKASAIAPASQNAPSKAPEARAPKTKDEKTREELAAKPAAAKSSARSTKGPANKSGGQSKHKKK
jgi:hypothetical protein